MKKRLLFGLLAWMLLAAPLHAGTNFLKAPIEGRWWAQRNSYDEQAVNKLVRGELRLTPQRDLPSLSISIKIPPGVRLYSGQKIVNFRNVKARQSLSVKISFYITSKDEVDISAYASIVDRPGFKLGKFFLLTINPKTRHMPEKPVLRKNGQDYIVY